MQGWDEALIADALESGRAAAREELDWEEAALADPTRRALPSDSLRRHTPPRFASEVIQGIRQGAAKLFKARAAAAHPLCPCLADVSASSRTVTDACTQQRCSRAPNANFDHFLCWDCKQRISTVCLSRADAKAVS